MLRDILNIELTWLSDWLGEDNGTPLQYCCPENPRDGGAWWAAVHGVAKSRTRLSDFTFTFHFPALEKDWSDLVAVVVVTDWASLVAQMVKRPACNAGDLGLIPGLGRSPGEENGKPLQYSCLEKFHGWRSLVVAKSRTWLSNFTG